jgi:hypothetical protein
MWTDPVFDFAADPNPYPVSDFLSDVDPASENDSDSVPQHCLQLLLIPSLDFTDSKKKKKKEKKKHKKRKKKSDEKKKKKKRSKDSDSEEEGSGWRLQLLNKMKEIKKLPPEQLEVEFKKAMAEKRRKEEEEKCLEQIKLRQKLARKVKKEAERAARKAAKEARRKARKEEGEGGGGNAFYAGFTAAMARGEEGLAGPPGGGGGGGSPPPPVPAFKPAFSEEPYMLDQGKYSTILYYNPFTLYVRYLYFSLLTLPFGSLYSRLIPEIGLSRHSPNLLIKEDTG